MSTVTEVYQHQYGLDQEKHGSLLITARLIVITQFDSSLLSLVKPSLLLVCFILLSIILTLAMLSHWIFMTMQMAKCPLRVLSFRGHLPLASISASFPLAFVVCTICVRIIQRPYLTMTSLGHLRKLFSSELPCVSMKWALMGSVTAVFVTSLNKRTSDSSVPLLCLHGLGGQGAKCCPF